MKKNDYENTKYEEKKIVDFFWIFGNFYFQMELKNTKNNLIWVKLKFRGVN